MKIFCISDSQDISVGLKLSGINSVTLTSKNDVLTKIDDLLAVKDIGVLVVTKNIYNIAKDKLDDIKLDQKFTLIVTIPNQ